MSSVGLMGWALVAYATSAMPLPMAELFFARHCPGAAPAGARCPAACSRGADEPVNACVEMPNVENRIILKFPAV